MNIYSPGIKAQQQRLLDHMNEHGAVTTYEAREQLNIASPAPRILELKQQGYLIYTSLETLPDSNGVLHPRSARYILLSGVAANDE